MSGAVLPLDKVQPSQMGFDPGGVVVRIRRLMLYCNIKGKLYWTGLIR